MADQIDLLVLGDANPDLVLTGEVEPSFGQSEQLLEEAHLTVGGSGAIAACGAARLGIQVAFCGVVGDDVFGRFMRDELEGRGVDASGLVLDRAGRTGLTVALSLPDDRAILTHKGTIGDLRTELIAPDLLASARHIHVSSYFLQSHLAPELPALFEQAHHRGITTSFDPNWDPSERWNGSVKDLLTHTDVFLPNTTEATRIAAIESVDEAAVTLATRAGLVVAKTGRKGALAAKGGRLTHAPGFPVESVDTTGAGDAFDAGFLASWLGGDSLERALSIANACGAISTLALGGVDSQPTMKEVLSFVTDYADRSSRIR